MDIKGLTFISDSEIGLVYEVEFSRAKTFFRKNIKEKRKIWIMKCWYDDELQYKYSCSALDYETGKHPYDNINLSFHLSQIITHDFEVQRKINDSLQ